MTSTLPTAVVLDTCVLLSSVLRRLLLQLAGRNCFSVFWTPVIGDEWRRNAARLWQAAPDDIALQWQAIQQAFPAADLGDVSAFKEGLRRSDPKDFHVIAAGRAVVSRHPEDSVAIVTRNLKDFNRSELRGCGLGLLEPDQFLVQCHARFPHLLQTALVDLQNTEVAPGRTMDPLDLILRRERLFRFSKVLACPR